jgi:hypothetical protein
MAHWHDFNPWAAELIYLPSLEEAQSVCVPDGQIERWLHTSKLYGTPGKLDAYLLRDGPLSRHTREMHLGVRYGPEGSQYFSPYVPGGGEMYENMQAKALELYFKYGGPRE